MLNFNLSISYIICFAPPNVFKFKLTPDELGNENIIAIPFIPSTSKSFIVEIQQELKKLHNQTVDRMTLSINCN